MEDVKKFAIIADRVSASEEDVAAFLKSHKSSNSDGRSYVSVSCEGTNLFRLTNDLNAALADHNLDGIIALDGVRALQSLDKINYVRGEDEPVLCAHGDASALLLATFAMTGKLGWYANLTEFLMRLKQGLSGSQTLTVHGEIIRGGVATGILMASEMSAFTALIGTRYMPKLDDAVLILEAHAKPSRIDMSLTQLLLFLQASKSTPAAITLVLGLENDKYDFEASRRLLRDRILDFNCPAVICPPDPTLCLPFGAACVLDLQHMSLSYVVD
jgi:muramoyltetrapeptide carboxypeptidase LdcA involved in peptidoglycan recycling